MKLRLSELVAFIVAMFLAGIGVARWLTSRGHK